MNSTVLSVAIATFLMADLNAQVSARLFRYPDVSKTQITFVYGGDIWVTDKSGGSAVRLSSPAGEELFPKFSPDGSEIAFSGNYDGNMDIYTISVQGGIPNRVTHHGMMDRILDWYPEGSHLLFASSGESGKQRFSQLYKVEPSGGLPEKLPLAYGEFASISSDGENIAFTEKSRMLRSWKRYRGGMNSDIWIFNLKTLESRKITDSNANHEIPMWTDDKVYYLSDEGPELRYNIWVYDLGTGKNTQVTHFAGFDVHFPSIGPDEIVFEAGGKLYLLDLKTHQHREVSVNVVTDLMAVKPRVEEAKEYVMNIAIAPDGNRALVEARGEIFSLPAEKGYVQNLTRSSGVAERNPAWSPDGKYVAYWSDQTGEYELTIRDMTQGAKERTLTTLGPGFRYRLYWSPDSRKIAFVDQTMTIQIYDMETNQVRKVDQDVSLFEGGLRGWRPAWSSDSQWMAFSKNLDNRNGAIFIYNADSGELRQATSGFYSDVSPTFDPGGDYLYVLTNRNFSPEYSDFDNTWIYPNATQIAAISLRADVGSPLAAENDTVAIAGETETEKSGEGNSKSKKDESSDTADTEDSKDKSKPVKIDFEGFERRMIILPPNAGNIGGITALDGKIAFIRSPNTGSDDNENTLKYYDLEKREEKTVIEGIRGFVLSADGKKVLINKSGQYSIIEFGADKKAESTLALEDMEMTVDPREEWRQIFNDAWRFQRDFFYDKDMHGVDWSAMREQYGALIDHCANRADVNFVLGELIGELNASHTYRYGGDSNEETKSRAVGYLGVNWEKKDGFFAVKEIIRGAPWDTEVRSPLDEPGVNVGEGDYILAVNGIALNEYSDPWAAFEGLSNKTVELTVSSTPSWDDSRTIVVKTLSDETRLRNLAWIESNRKRVDEASGGKIGYIYVPSTGVDGQNELVRQFYGQWNKEGLVIDERFNNGGQIPDRFVELLNRKPLAYFDVRDGANWQWPPIANFGSMAMLINGWSGSGGDAFPDFFRKSGLGPVIGTRTWGGVIGLSGSPQLIDGGSVTVPTFRQYNPDGSWFKEGHGVDPDIHVPEDPTALAKGIDPQLEKAIEQVMKSIGEKGPIHPPTPAKEDRTRTGKT